MNNFLGHANDPAAEMRKWRRDFHQHLELGFKEHRTAGKIAGLLRGFGLEFHEGIGSTGVVGLLKRGTGIKSIGLRADMHALAINEKSRFSHQSKYADRMHACGHDGHMAMLLGAAKSLAGEGNFDGMVVFIFQPAEEHGRGALAMIDDGLFQRFKVDAIYGIHNMPSKKVGEFALCAGAIMAFEDNFEIIVHGKGGHAALPHLAIDPIVVVSQIVVALQNIVSRAFDPLVNAVLSVTDFSADATRNAIPDAVGLRGDTRCFSGQNQTRMETAIEHVVSGTCKAGGASYTFDCSREFPATINSENEASIAAEVARLTFGNSKVYGNCPPVVASEDFGFMLQYIPGCYLFIGNRGETAGSVDLHNPHYDFNDEILSPGAKFRVSLVQSQLA